MLEKALAEEVSDKRSVFEIAGMHLALAARFRLRFELHVFYDKPFRDDL